MKFLLDLSEVKNTGLSSRALNFKIPCKTGEHQLNFDVIECDVPKDIYLDLIINAKSPQTGDIEAFPVGFNILPVGAKLERTS